LPELPIQMKILVPTKRVPDPDQPVQLNSSATAVDLEDVSCMINPFDAIALEEALRIREEDRAGEGEVEVVAVSIGNADSEKELRIALAMGADRAILVNVEGGLDPWGVAGILKAVADREQPDLVLMGKQAVDDDCNQAGQFLAAQLAWPQATFASKLEFLGDGRIQVARETDAGTEVVSMKLPAVVTADLRLCEPRYASLPAIMKARKQLLEKIPAADLGVALEPKVEVLEMQLSNPKRQCVRVGSVDELIEKLRGAGAL
jgi:electron transfer flavoprotein beta subunit